MSAIAHNQIADYLVYGEDSRPRKWDSNTITVNYAGVASNVQWMVQLALDTWESVTGIEFVLTNNTGSSDILFYDDFSGAYSQYSWTDTSTQRVMNWADVNVSTNWIASYGIGVDTYSFQTYLHEIGHAIGLGHPGPYNGAGVTFGTHAIFPNDSWQASLMSYFSQGENPNVNASDALVITPMIADVLAMWELYGKPNDLRTGNTTYGVGSNAGGVYDQIASLGYRVAFNIVDDGGWDIINFANDTRNQKVNLNAETYSNVYGLIGNMAIMRDTIIEQYIAGSGNDEIVGNTAQNTISGNGGNDTIRSSSNGFNNNKIFGGSGNDVIHVANGQGEDTVYGDAGNDLAIVTNNSGSFSGGSGTDTVRFISGLEKYLFINNGNQYEFINVLTGQTFTVMNDVELFQFLNNAYQYNLAQLVSATQITTIESTGTILQHAAQGFYLVGGPTTNVVVTLNGNVVGEDTINGWTAINVQAQIFGGYRLMWKNDDGEFFEWILDSQGAQINGALVTNIVDSEEYYGADFNGDGTIGHTTSVVENAGSNTLTTTTEGPNGTIYLIDGSTQIKLNNIAMGPDSLSGWSAVHAEADGGGFRVLWENVDGSYFEWVLDGQGEQTSGTLVDNVVDLEQFYGVDLNNDGTIGHINNSVESTGSTTLATSTQGSSGVTYLINGTTEIFLNGEAMGPDSLAGWSAIHAEADGGGYRVLWKHDDGRYFEWVLNGQGEQISGVLVENIVEIEQFYGVDLNKDSTVGHTTSAIETDGSTNLELSTRGVYLINGTTEITLRGEAMGPGSLAGWDAVQAEADGGGYRVLWKHDDGRYFEWVLDSQGEQISGSAIDNVVDVEQFYDADLNDDASVGHTTSSVEANGSTTLSISTQGSPGLTYLINGATEITLRAAAMGPESLAGWSAVQAEADGGGYRVLWKHDDGRYFEWVLDSQGEQISGSLVDNVVDLEQFYDADLNNDATVGHTTSSIETDGSTNLELSTRGVYLINGTTEITLRGEAMGPDSLAGWSAIHVEASGGGYRLLWKHDDGRYFEWVLDSQGAQLSGALINDVKTVEAFYGADIDEDTYIGPVINNVPSSLSANQNPAPEFARAFALALSEDEFAFSADITLVAGSSFEDHQDNLLGTRDASEPAVGENSDVVQELGTEIALQSLLEDDVFML